MSKKLEITRAPIRDRLADYANYNGLDIDGSFGEVLLTALNGGEITTTPVKVDDSDLERIEVQPVDTVLDVINKVRAGIEAMGEKPDPMTDALKNLLQQLGETSEG